jgi:hypothetical protein
MRNRLVSVAVVTAIAASLGCSGGDDKLIVLEPHPATDGGTHGAQDTGTTTTADSASKPGDSGAQTVPCAVTTALMSCQVCHGTTPVTGALTSLVSYADLTKMAELAPTVTETAESVALMQGGSPVMPPGGGASTADIAALQTWITGGYLSGAACGSASPEAGTSADTGTHPTDAGTHPADTGTSPADSGGGTGVFAGEGAYVSMSGGSGHHNAGQDCMSSCHNHGFTFAGTLYNGSGSAVSNAEVRLVDSTGKGISAYSGTNGNFYSSSSWTGPGTVGVRDATNPGIDMVATVSTGVGCNSCHSSSGSTSQIYVK